jgi:hypothetical protein
LDYYELIESLSNGLKVKDPKKMEENLNKVVNRFLKTDMNINDLRQASNPLLFSLLNNMIIEIQEILDLEYELELEKQNPIK